jgi:hypothetical protein
MGRVEQAAAFGPSGISNMRAPVRLRKIGMIVEEIHLAADPRL